MDLVQILKREEESKARRIFIYIEENKFKAYEFSAYVLSECFENFDFRKEYRSENGIFVWTGMAELDFLMNDGEFRLSAGNDFIEVYIPVSKKYRLPHWKAEFERIKRNGCVRKS